MTATDPNTLLSLQNQPMNSVVTQENSDFLMINNIKIDMPATPYVVLEVDDKIIVLLKSNVTKPLSHLTKPHANGNIICLNYMGEWLWEVEHQMPTFDEAPGGAFNPFSIIEIGSEAEAKNKHVLLAWNGDHRAMINIDTGKFIEYEFTK